LQRELAEHGVEEDVLIGLEDYVSAFKTLAPEDGQRWAMHMLVFDTDAQEWKVGELLSMPFGAMGSVLAWWRVATALKVILRRLFELVVFYYVDDVQQIEVASTAHHGKFVFTSCMELLGWSLDVAKSQDMSSSAKSLGCEVQITKEGVIWSLSVEKAEKWDMELAQCLADDAMSSECAGRMAGRLQFGSERVFARGGRAAIRPLYWRQQSSVSRKLTPRLRSCLRWWRCYLESRPSRKIAWSKTHAQCADVLVYTDAERQGHIGVVVLDLQTSQKFFVCSAVPRWIKRGLRRRRTQINLFELAAVCCAVSTFKELLEGKKVVFFIDNQAALNMLVKGYSRAIDANQMTFSILLNVAKLGIDAHWAYVKSKSNIADGPSRGWLHEMACIRADEIRATWPESMH